MINWISGPIFSHALSKLHEQGIIVQALREYKGADPKHKESDTHTLSVGQTLLVFIVIGCGVALSWIMFGLELVFRKHDIQFDILARGVKSPDIEEDRASDSPTVPRPYMSTAQVDRILRNIKMRRSEKHFLREEMSKMTSEWDGNDKKTT